MLRNSSSSTGSGVACASGIVAPSPELRRRRAARELDVLQAERRARPHEQRRVGRQRLAVLSSFSVSTAMTAPFVARLRRDRVTAPTRVPPMRTSLPTTRSAAFGTSALSCRSGRTAGRCWRCRPGRRRRGPRASSPRRSARGCAAMRPAPRASSVAPAGSRGATRPASPGPRTSAGAAPVVAGAAGGGRRGAVVGRAGARRRGAAPSGRPGGARAVAVGGGRQRLRRTRSSCSRARARVGGARSLAARRPRSPRWRRRGARVNFAVQPGLEHGRVGRAGVQRAGRRAGSGRGVEAVGGRRLVEEESISRSMPPVSRS